MHRHDRSSVGNTRLHSRSIFLLVRLAQGLETLEMISSLGRCSPACFIDMSLCR